MRLAANIASGAYLSVVETVRLGYELMKKLVAPQWPL
jgi:hypothetical protein